MKQIKKTVILSVFAFVMTLMASVGVKAADLAWGKGYEINHEENGSFDINTDYNFVLSTSGSVVLTVNCTEYAHKGKIIIYNSSDESVWSQFVPIGLNTYKIDLLAGTYKLRVNSISRLKESFVPTFTASGETVSESYMNKNNQVGTASAYAVGSTVKAQFARNDDTDIYKMSVKKPGYLTVKFSSNLTKMNMQMVSTDGKTSYRENNIPLGASSYKYFVPKGTYYVSFVRADKDYTGTYTFSTKLSGITMSKVKSAKNLKGKKVKITWTKKSDVNGYQVQVAQNKKFTKGKKTKTITKKTVKSHTFTKLKKGKTYYARVRTYKLVNGKKHYSDWSTPKKFKVKK
nr:fibronectin type III domain-containing protein [Lachnospiraceae bacterium]